MTEQKPQKMSLVGVMGDPVDENPSYIMEEAAFKAAGLNWRYMNLPVKSQYLKAAVEGARAMNFQGFNVTTPHKVAILPLLDKVADDARLIGAVNTVWRDGDRFIGENTDGKGFMRSLRDDAGINPASKRIVCLGAGGAARAICTELALAGAAHILVVNRTRERGETLTENLNKNTDVKADFHLWRGYFDIPRDTDIIVQATSIGLFPNVNDIPAVRKESLKKNMIVCDVIPNPPKTPFLKMAEQAGAVCIDGLGMLIYQGAIAFEKWTGQKPSLQAMRSSLEEALRT